MSFLDFLQKELLHAQLRIQCARERRAFQDPSVSLSQFPPSYPFVCMSSAAAFIQQQQT